MLARTTAFSTAGIVFVVFGSLILFSKGNGEEVPIGGAIHPLLLGSLLILAGCALAARVWYQNARGDQLRPGMLSRTRGT